MYRFRLTETSEKTIEINILSDLTSSIEKLSGRRVTVISPTAQDERNLGFDEIIEGLPPGQGIAFQFKRPFVMKRPRHCVRFTIDTRQLRTLLNIFLPQEAHYVFTPYPLNRDIVKNRMNLLRDTTSVDIYDVPKGRKSIQKTRTVRYYTGGITITGRSSRMLKIADPGKFEKIKKVNSLEDIAGKLVERKIGFQVPLSKERKQKMPLRKLFYLHLALE